MRVSELLQEQDEDYVSLDTFTVFVLSRKGKWEASLCPSDAPITKLLDRGDDFTYFTFDFTDNQTDVVMRVRPDVFQQHVVTKKERGERFLNDLSESADVTEPRLSAY